MSLPSDPVRSRSSEFWDAMREESGKRKPVEDVINETPSTGRRLTRRHLVSLGLAVLIGSGAFTLLPNAVAERGVQATAVGLALGAVACLGAALCFAEMASTVPVGGSAYTYSYVTFGRLRAWLVGWLLLLQYSVGAGVAAIDWVRFATAPFLPAGTSPPRWLSLVLGAALLILTCLALLTVARSGKEQAGKEQSRRNTSRLIAAIGVSVVAKVGALVVVSAVGVYLALTSSSLGVVPVRDVPFSGAAILPAVAVVYYAFIGFDSVSTAAEEARFPPRDLPRSILAVLGIATIVYFAQIVANLLLSVRAGSGVDLVSVLEAHAPWTSTVVYIGTVLGLPSEIVVLTYALSRIFRAVWRDGLVRVRLLARPVPTDPGPRLECVGAAFFGLAWIPVALYLSDTTTLTTIASLATAGAFAIVAISTAVLRRSRPDLPRTFRVPLLPVVGGGTVLISVVLFVSGLGQIRWVLYWLLAGTAIQIGFLLPHARDALQKQRAHLGGAG